MSKRKSILFITPYLERSGSEIVLYNLILKIYQDFNITIICFHPGTLINDFPKEIKINIIKTPSSLVHKAIDLIRRKLTNKNCIHRQVMRIERKIQSDLWFINTISMPQLLTIAELEKKKTYIYIHELVQMVEAMNQDEFNRLVYFPEKIFCCSNVAAQTIYTMGRNHCIHTIHPGIDIVKLNEIQGKRFKNIESDTFVWGMSGRLNFNKNPVFFIELANLIVSKYPSVHFIWFGNQIDSPLFDYCLQLQKKYKLENKITWAGLTAGDYFAFFKSINGLVLTSLYESFSMITLEAISQGIPVVTHNSGGVIEILGADYPIAKSHSVGEYCNLMLRLMNDFKFAKNITEIGMDRSKHFDLNEKASLFKELLNY